MTSPRDPAPRPSTTTGASAWRRSAAAGVDFPAVGDDDLDFLRRVYASTRWEELAPIPWSEAEKATFLNMQFRAQHNHYRQHYPTALWLLIRYGGEPVGRLYLDRWPQEHRLVDIALLPAYRGLGFGTAILQDLIDEAGEAAKPLSIHVEKTNPAMTLYRRLGFHPIGETGIYDLMSRAP